MSIINHSAVLHRDTVDGLPINCEGMAVAINTSEKVTLAATASPAMGVACNIMSPQGLVMSCDIILLGSGIVADVQVAAGTYAAGSYLIPAASGGLWVAATAAKVGASIRVTSTATLSANALISALI